jgi:hypothetical protein
MSGIAWTFTRIPPGLFGFRREPMGIDRIGLQVGRKNCGAPDVLLYMR